jgi:hypothetical protein
MPPFKSKHTTLQLLEIVRTVSLSVSPRDPVSVTQTAWDWGRVTAGHPDAPRAHGIAQRLGIPWSRVLAIAHGNPRDALRALGNAQADKGRRGLTLERIGAILRHAARSLDKRGIHRSDYVRARKEMLAATRRTRARAAGERAMPALTQIETVLAQHEMSWEDALEVAGLELPARFDDSGLDAEAGVRAFVENVGSLPRSANQLREWAQATGASIGNLRWAAVQQATALVQREHTVSSKPPLAIANLGEHLAGDRRANRNGRPTRKREWGKPDVLAGLTLAVTMLDGQQLTQRSLKQLVKDNPGCGVPSWSSVDRCLRANAGDTWEQYRRDAEAESARLRGH